METKCKECKFKEYKFRIPILVNKKKINKGEFLLKWNDLEMDDEENEETRPAKKMRV